MADVPNIDCGNLNATECLLKTAAIILSEVKHISGEYNWDPLTFAATLVIGLVALFFASLTIGQGLLAAGPGRNKCVKYALGSWAQLTKRRMRWLELRYYSIAYTPVIRIEYLLEVSWPIEHGWYGGPITGPWTAATRALKIDYTPKPLDEYFPATWLALLTCIGLDHPGLWIMKPTGADYIPTELAAAPAYSSIRDLIALLAVREHPNRLQLIKQDDLRLISARGGDCDLDFRYHPSLGIYGVFQAYSTSEELQKRWFGKGNDFKTSSLNPITLRILLYANGYVPQHKALGNNLVSGINQCQHIYQRARNVMQRNNRAKARFLLLTKQCSCSTTSSRTENSSGLRCCGGDGASVRWPTWCTLKHRGKHEIPENGLMDRIGTGIDEIGLTLLAAEAPPIAPTLFPRSAVRLGQHLDYLCCLSRRWSLSDPGVTPDFYVTHFDPTLISMEGNALLPVFRATRTTYMVCRDNPADEKLLNGGGSWIPEDALHTSDLPTCIPKAREEIARIDMWLEKHFDQSTVLCRWLSLSYMASCLRYIYETHEWTNLPLRQSREDEGRGSKFFPADTTFRSDSIRRRLDIILTSIDDFLNGDGLEHNPMQVYNILFTQLGPSEVPSVSIALEITRELHKFRSSWEMKRADPPKGFSQFAPPRKEFSYSAREVQHPLDDLLIYRAMLVALLFSATTDNSEVNENETYRRIIPIL